jgi:DNA-binding NtrC family response regulator
VIPLQLAPLRDRREDVLPLARHFLARHAAEAGRRLAFSEEAETALIAHAWPGNVRELENAVERGVVLARGEQVTPEDLLLQETIDAPIPGGAGTLHDAVDRASVERVTAALEAANGNRTEAARALGIDRTTLYRLMRRLGL